MRASSAVPSTSRTSVAVVRGWEYALGIAMGILFLIPLLIDGPFEEEEVLFGMFPSQVHYQALLRGEWLYWFNDLGFGTPLPLGLRIDFHPLFALSAVTSLRIALSAVWLAHVTLGVIYFLRLAAATGIQFPLRLILLWCYVFSAISVTYFYLNDWVTSAIAWTFYPMLVFYLRDALLGGALTNFWLTACRLALLFGFWFLNGTPGLAAPTIAILAVYALAAAPLDRRVCACLAIAGLLSAAITMERVYFVGSEALLFPESAQLPRPVLSVAGYIDAALTPFVPFESDLRLPFVGLVIGLAALASVITFLHRADRHVRACTIAFAAAVVLGVVPREVSKWFSPSGAWLFRDSMVFFALLAGGWMLQQVLQNRRSWLRTLAWVLVAVQVAQQAATTVVPGLREHYGHRGRLLFYRYQGEAVGVGRTLVDRARQFGTRLYLSEGSGRLIRGSLSPYGVHFLTDLTFLGLNPLNGWFYSISMDRLSPSYQLMHGSIGSEWNVVENRTLLDVLAINLILIVESEGPVPSDLPVLDRTPVDTFRGPHTLALLANPDAWPRAVLMNVAARATTLPVRAGCSHAAAMCRDYAPLVEMRLPGDVALTAEHGHYRARIPPAAEERVLFLSATYRSEWEATASGRPLRIDPVANAFLGVTVPAGVDEIDIVFKPRVRIVLTWLSNISFVGLLATAGTLWWRRKARH